MKYRYTCDGGNFTDEQRRFYEENGFIVFKKLIPDQDLDDCRKRFLEICDGKERETVLLIMLDPELKKKGVTGERSIVKIQDFLHDEVFYTKYGSHPKIIEIVKNIVGPNITGMHSMLINKPPDTTVDSSRHPLHQDQHYFPFRPSERICASWTAMEKIDEINGCLFVIPGSHKSKLFAHDYPSNGVNKAYHGVKGFDNIPKVNLIMEKGDTVFFHPLLLHGSGPNLTKGFRKAISVHYADTNCNFIDVRGTTQENIAREIEAMSAKRGINADIVDVWKIKSRLIAGEEGNFQQPSKL